MLRDGARWAPKVGAAPGARMQISFCGQAVSARELALIEGLTESCTGLSRTELARTVCELLG